ncbi:MAG: heme exporter protein CcmD [Proteobacteria bacterium]|nr:heme exporter protein CcmD [Pseudomonadota bacterium]MCL2308090.1 heme exporter protein CcmD [Pseudomonadota bacterium]
MGEFFAMGGYAFFIWMAYGMTALLIVAEIVTVRARYQRALHLARHSEAHEAAAGAQLKEAE